MSRVSSVETIHAALDFALHHPQRLPWRPERGHDLHKEIVAAQSVLLAEQTRAYRARHRRDAARLAALRKGMKL